VTGDRNIGGAEQGKRWALGAAATVAALAASVAFNVGAFPLWIEAASFFPWWFGGLCFLQAGAKT